MVKDYGIRYDPENPVPADDGQADNLYEAAVEFLSQAGVHCQDTNRVIQFSREEILRALNKAPGRCLAGEGKDAGVSESEETLWPYCNLATGPSTLT